MSVSRVRRIIGLAVLLLLAAPSAQANIRSDGASELPYYARPLFGEEWSVIVFYRPPSCVPRDFDLFTFFDVPRVFDCDPPTTDGFTVSEDGAPIPIHLKLRGLGAVPIWFVRTAELAAVAADNAITIEELAALPSLMVGTASFYQEVLHPLVRPDRPDHVAHGRRRPPRGGGGRGGVVRVRDQ